MKARIKGEDKWDDFTPIFNLDGQLSGFIRTTWFDEYRNGNVSQLSEWPFGMLVFPEDVQEENFKKIDWEQRRYEIAKDILVHSHIAQQIGNYSYIEENEIKDAVRMADLLIAELSRPKIGYENQ